MYTFENLSFRYRDYIFWDFTDSIPESKIGIVGKNGSGKTTLLKLLDGELEPEKGRVEVDGSTYFIDFELRRYRHFTALDMVELCGTLDSFDVSQAGMLMTSLGLAEYQAIPIGELSKGASKKVSLLMGLMAVADVLLIDEPFESIDAQSNDNLIELLRNDPRSFVVVSHDLVDLERTVDVVYAVQDQKLVRQ